VPGKQFLFADRGEVDLHGFHEPVWLFEVRWGITDRGCAFLRTYR